MSEYIGYKEPIGNGLFNMGLTDEEIVRCRDCKWLKSDKCRCRRFLVPYLSEDGTIVKGAFFIDNVNPNGYCAWGEKRCDG